MQELENSTEKLKIMVNITGNNRNLHKWTITNYLVTKLATRQMCGQRSRAYFPQGNECEEKV